MTHEEYKYLKKGDKLISIDHGVVLFDSYPILSEPSRGCWVYNIRESSIFLPWSNLILPKGIVWELL